MAKITLFYRRFLSDKTCLNLGVFGSIANEGQPYRGFEGEIFYGWKVFKIGHGLQIGIFTDEMSDYGGDEFLWIINPVILQVNL